MRYLRKLLDKRLSKRLVRRLYSTPKNEWLEILHNFNGWGFPLSFFDLIPRWWASDHDTMRKYNVIKPVMKIVKKEFSEEERLRYHNVSCLNMNNKEFDYWFKNVSYNHSETNYYSRRFKMNGLEWWRDDVYEKLEKSGVFNLPNESSAL